MKEKKDRFASHLRFVGLSAGLATLAAARVAAAAPAVSAGYSLSVFAVAPAGATAADDVAIGNGYVFVDFGNGGLPDGSDGKFSTVAQYTTTGVLVRTYSLRGHTDGIRVDPSTGLLWSVQNEDANPNLQIINPVTGTQTPYKFGPTPHGGGYDDLRFLGGSAYLSASNPTLTGSAMINTGPALVRATLSGGSVDVAPVIQGNATAIDQVTALPVALNLTDPDSLAIDQTGNLVLDSQQDNELAIIHDAGSASPSIRRLALVDSAGAGVSVDDSLFAPAGVGKILLVDSGTDVIYAVTGAALATGHDFSNLPAGTTPNAGTFDALNVSTGLETPVITGLGSPKGLAFLPATVPLPAAAWTGLAGLAVVVAAQTRSRHRLDA